MSRTRIVGGTYTKITGGTYKMYTEGDTIISAAGKNDFANAENIIIGTNPERCEFSFFSSEYILEGYWSSDKEGKNKITRASLGDIVYFCIKLKI